MTDLQTLREEAMRQAQGAMSLQVAFLGVARGLFTALVAGPATAAELAERAGADAGYVTRWCDAAYAFGYLDAEGDAFRLTDKGDAFRPEAEGSLMPLAIQPVLGAHMVERAASLMLTGERPGESVLGERPAILPWFGPMLEASFGPVFEGTVLPAVPVFAEVGARGGLAVDLGCGNGWYLRRLAKRFPKLTGIGLDGIEENIRQASARANAEGLGERLDFRAGDLHHFAVDRPADLIAMNRALHHVWDQKENVARILDAHLAPGGAVVIWEPAWPDDRAELRTPPRRGMAVQNLSEHVQGNHFLRPAEIEAALGSVGLETEVFRFREGAEAVVVGRRQP